MDVKGCIIFNSEDYSCLTTGLQLAKCMLRGETSSVEPSEDTLSRQLEEVLVADAHSCSCCGVQFDGITAQRAHFKLDWHRFNIKRQLVGLSTIREEVFDSLADKDEVGSISGSESESDDDSKSAASCERSMLDSHSSVRHAKVFFQNGLGQIVSLYHCILSSSKDPVTNGPDLVKQALSIKASDSWAVIMLGGGHFAAGIFKGMESLVHKTFHCYTVRSKQGGSQSSRDNRGSGHPKSAGASLRRYNEQSLVQHVQEIISTWENYIKSCSLIFYRAVGPTNRSVLFGGKSPPLNKNDPRLRRIPFPTRRATYNEVLRVHALLAFMELHGLEEDFHDSYPPTTQKLSSKKPKAVTSEAKDDKSNEESPRKGRASSKSSHNRAKSRPSPNRPAPVSGPLRSSESDVMSGNESEMNFHTVHINLNESLKEFDQSVHHKSSHSKQGKSTSKMNVKTVAIEHTSKKTLSKAEKKKEEEIKALEAEKKAKIAEKKERKAAAAAMRKQQEEEEAAKDPLVVFQRALCAALQSGVLSDVQTCLSSTFIDRLPASLPGNLKHVLNLPLNSGNTALHMASKSGNNEIVWELMMSGADPSVKNKKSQPPYVVAASKETKALFTDFMTTYPDMYSYTDIPLPLTEEEEKEKADKKAALLKAKRAREKEKRRVQAEQKAENEEKERFLALSDREKRALAAEKRMLASLKRGAPDEKPVVLARCFTCAADITGQVPFEYEHYRFCTFDCLKAHRIQLKTLS